CCSASGSSHPFRRPFPRGDSSLAAQPRSSGRFAMKLSARNMIKGRVVDVTRGATTAHVRIDVGGGTVITASITNEAVDDLKLTRGDNAYAVIKAADVMVAKV